MKIYARILTAVMVAALSVGPVSAATVSSAAPATVAQAGTSATTATTGSLVGSVQDENGAPVANAEISLTGPATYRTKSDASGAWSINSITPGLYHINAHRPGYSTANDDVSVLAGVPQTLQVRLQRATLTSLTTIASVRAVGRGTFNTTPAAIDTVSAQVFQDQGSPQVGQVLNEIPGVQNSLPSSSANGASPGSITVPNVRGGLSFETATQIDGHPLAVGDYGDYVTTFLNAFMLQDAEVIKGPGATADQTNYAINGTINFRTKDPTLAPTPYYTMGIDDHGGSFFNFGLSDTVLNGRLGFVFDFANLDTVSAINNYQAKFSPVNGILTNPGGGLGNNYLGYNDSLSPIPGTNSSVYNQFGLVACCLPVSADLYGNSELVKLRYKLSNATTVTASYFGSQSTADQNANTGYQTYGEFNPGDDAKPGQVYGGPLAAGSPVLINQLYPITNKESNNEPIFQAEFNTTLGNDTILGRYYHAAIQRLGNQGGDNPFIPETGTFTLNGIDPYGGVFNNVTEPLGFYAYYHQNEIDSLNGDSFQYSHPVANNTYTLAYTGTHTSSTDYTVEAPSLQGLSANGTFPAGTLPTVVCPTGGECITPGSGTFYQTITGRGQFELTPKLTGTAAIYENLYQNTYLVGCNGTGATAVTNETATCTYNDSGQVTNNGVMTTTNTSHLDDRFALEFRPHNDTALRFSAGSSIAPPFLSLLSSAHNSPTCSLTTQICTQEVNNPNLRPETAFGYDLGGDHRFKDHVTTVSGDVYITTLSNQFITDYTQNSGQTFTCSPSISYCPTGAAGTYSIYNTSNVNLNRSRYEGIELRLHRSPPQGFGYSLQGALTRAYVYDLPANFYCAAGGTACANPAQIGVVQNVNFNGGSYGSGISPAAYGVSNTNIPYLQAYAEANYRLRNGAFAQLGYTVYGKNNSLNEPPFGVTQASIRYPINKDLSVQISGYNIFNEYPGLFGVAGQGVGYPLATGALGATTAGQLGPAIYRFSLTKTVGAF